MVAEASAWNVSSSGVRGSVICLRSGHEIIWDGRVVWVNSGVDGSSIGRFSRQGIDVHVAFAEQLETGKVCIDCSADGSAEGWKKFQALLLEHYDVVVPDEAAPKNLRLG